MRTWRSHRRWVRCVRASGDPQRGDGRGGQAQFAYRAVQCSINVGTSTELRALRTFWNVPIALSKSAVAKKWVFRSEAGTWDHAFATAVKEGSNSLQTVKPPARVVQFGAPHLQGMHFLRGSSAVKWMLEDQVRLGCVKRLYVESSSLMRPLLAAASLTSFSCTSSTDVDAARQKGIDKRARNGSSSMAGRDKLGQPPRSCARATRRVTPAQCRRA